MFEVKTNIRRVKLLEWVTKNGTPTNEKSYFSQLISGKASFGEKAARRIEEDYGMGLGFLDGENIVKESQLIELLELWCTATPEGRRMILIMAQSVNAPS
jgi:hypothetical protein